MALTLQDLYEIRKLIVTTQALLNVDEKELAKIDTAVQQSQAQAEKVLEDATIKSTAMIEDAAKAKAAAEKVRKDAQTLLTKVQEEQAQARKLVEDATTQKAAAERLAKETQAQTEKERAELLASKQELQAQREQLAASQQEFAEAVRAHKRNVEALRSMASTLG